MSSVAAAELLPPRQGQYLAALSLAQGDANTAQAAVQPLLGADDSAAALELGSWADDQILFAEVQRSAAAAASSSPSAVMIPGTLPNPALHVCQILLPSFELTEPSRLLFRKPAAIPGCA